MSRKILILTITIILSLSTLTFFSSGEKISLNTNNEIQNLYVPGELIIKFKEEILLENTNKDNIQIQSNIESINQLNKKNNIEDTIKFFEVYSHENLKKVYKFVFDENTDIQSIANEYKNDPSVLYAHPNYIATSSTIVNDPFFDKQWGLHNVGQTGGEEDSDIDAPSAWNVQKGDEDITIAVIDTGIDYTHPDLADNIWTNPGEIENNGIDDDNNGYIDDFYGWDFRNNDNDPIDDYGHGTHCAGIAGAVTDNDIGIAGVSWYSKIMVIKLSNETGKSPIDLYLPAIYYAVDNGAKIISISSGFRDYSDFVEEAVDYAYENNVVVIAAAGNRGSNLKDYPAGYDNVIAVAAIDHNNTQALFSNFGRWLDIAAPGVNIYSTMPTYHVTKNDEGYSKNYDYMSGTSMSTPFVSGVVALMLSQNKNLTVNKIKKIIKENSDETNCAFPLLPIGGRINAYKSVKKSESSPKYTNEKLKKTDPFVLAINCNISIKYFGENENKYPGLIKKSDGNIFRLNIKGMTDITIKDTKIKTFDRKCRIWIFGLQLPSSINNFSQEKNVEGHAKLIIGWGY